MDPVQAGNNRSIWFFIKNNLDLVFDKGKFVTVKNPDVVLFVFAGATQKGKCL